MSVAQVFHEARQNESVGDRVRAIVAGLLVVDPSKVTDEARPIEDLGADSLDVYEFVGVIEWELGVAIPDRELEQIGTVGDLIAFVERQRL